MHVIEIAKDGTVYFTDASDILPWRRSDGHFATLESSILSYLVYAFPTVTV